MLILPSVPAGVCCMLATIDELANAAEDKLETTSLGDVAPKRAREFHAGRALARIAMSQLGLTPCTLPKGDDRLPAWPDGVVASISHTDNHVAVAMTMEDVARSIGLDIEIAGSVDNSLHSLILLDAEAANVNRGGVDATAYFSCKEAVFKSIFPLRKAYFDFTDVRIEFEGAPRFHAVPQFDEPLIHQGEGSMALCERHIVSLFMI